ncbi:MAG: penicillin-binding protein activator LpoB [Thermodesulfobacteriota bacterium]
MRIGNTLILGVVCVIVFTVSGCVGPEIKQKAGKPAEYEDPGTAGAASGVGMESQDLIGMTDKMARDMLANPLLAAAPSPPRVIIDAEFFINESSTRIDKNMITDRLRIELNRAASGRMRFVGRQNVAMVEKERQLKREGVVTKGVKYAEKTTGADYRLTGRITTIDHLEKSSGTAARFTQIAFEMIDLETAEIVWGGLYEFKKSAADDVIYR